MMEESNGRTLLFVIIIIDSAETDISYAPYRLLGPPSIDITSSHVLLRLFLCGHCLITQKEK